MFICLSILIITLYFNIDQFSPESKTVKLEELVQKYEGNEMDDDCDNEKLLPSSGSHKRHNSLYRFDQFYKHYMTHLLDEM